MLRLRNTTPDLWVEAIVGDLDGFLKDHAANERKVSGSAMTLAAQYPERRPLVDAMVDLAREELEHFKRVYDLLVGRGQTLGQDAPDPYMREVRRLLRRRDVEEYLVDRLIVFGVVEARACERFTLLGRALPDAELRQFYRRLARAEARHHGLFMRLAHCYACCHDVSARLAEVLDAEAEIVAALPVHAALH
jgi:tRNA 2-(methylsulfanyl)-N6-isopentenyladenosine37 hydroxylase